MASIRGPTRGVATLPGGLVQDDCAGCRDVERTDAASHRNAQEMVASAANEIVEACAFAAEDKHAVAAEVELVVVGRASFIQADDPDVLLLQIFKGADQIDDAGNAQVFRGTGAGLHGNGAEWGGTALSEDNAVDTGSVGNAEESAEILRIFNAVEGEEQAWLRGIGRGEQVFDRELFLRTDESDNALVCRGAGEVGELFARFLANADAGLLAISDQAREAFVVALGGNDDVIEAASAGLEGLGNRVHAVENFHVFSVDGALGRPAAASYSQAAFSLVVADKPQVEYWGHWAITQSGIYLLNTDSEPRSRIEFLRPY